MKKVRTIIFCTLTLLLLPCLCWAASPVIDSISPTSHEAGTFDVVISGKNFVGTRYILIYKAGTRRLVARPTFSVNSDTQITANVSLDAGSYYLRLLNGRYYANSPTLTVTAKSTVPVITSISPTSHTAGTFDVVISGENFTGTSFVRIYKNDTKYLVTESGFSVNSDTQITANVSLDAGSYYLRLQNGNNYANSPTLNVTATMPNITAIYPNNHVAGTFPVIINGNNLDQVTAVTIKNASSEATVNTPGFTIDSTYQITAAATLQQAGDYYVQVQAAAGSANSPTMRVTAPTPSISSISPDSHVAGAFPVVISGTNFDQVTAVSINNASTGLPVSNPGFTIDSATQITANTDLAAGSYYLKLTTAETTSNNSPILEVTQAAPPPEQPSTPTSYKLKSTVPSVVNVGTVSEGVSTAGIRVMWRDGNGVVHLLAAFGGDEQSGWFGHYVNMSTGAHALTTSTAKGCGQGWAYHPTYNKLYGSTGYASSQSSFFEFDPATQTIKLIADKCLMAPIGEAVIGDDNRVYQYVQGCKVYSYDPAVGLPGGWKDYGVVLPGLNAGSNYRGLAVDSKYVYCAVVKANGTWTLAITPIDGTPNWKEWEFGNAGDTILSISRKRTTHEWYVYRRLANGSSKVYWLANGTYTDSGLTDLQDEYDLTTVTPFCYAANNESMYHVMPDHYGWEPDFTDLFPIKGIHEYSTIRYRRVGAKTWKESTVNFTGPWVPQNIQCVASKADYTTLAVSSGYNASVSLDQANFQPTYLGANCFSPYESMNHPNGEIYVGGYANKVFRYNPKLPWTLTTANAAPRLPSDKTKPNPYFIKMPGDTYQYRHCLDYDAHGFVWIGGNTTRQNPDYGNVMWYNPKDGSCGYIFPTWKAAGTLFRNLCAANQHRSICVSDNGGNIWIIDAATKKVDPTPIRVPGKAYMIEVANDIVLGIVIGPTNKVIRFRPSTKKILTLQDLGVSGTPFGYGDNQYDRMNYKLEKGPDGYVWMFVGESLYRVHPVTSTFSKVLNTTHAKLKFASNNKDLLLYDIAGTTDFKYIRNILEAVSPR